MTIKIPISADTGGVKQDLGKVEESFSDISKAVEKIEEAANRTADALDRVVKQTIKATEATTKANKESHKQVNDPGARRGLSEIDKRVEAITKNSEKMARLHGILGKVFGRSLTADEARKVVHGFESSRAISPRLREFGDIVDFYENTGRAFPSDRAGRRRAARYRRSVFNRSAIAGDVAPPAAGGGIFENARERGVRAGLKFGTGMLALAGIAGVAAMAAKATDLATEESVGIDTLKRSLGDTSVDFDRLRDQIRGAGDGLGIASVESMRLAQHFTKIANSDKRSDVTGEVRSATGFARAFGVDPNSSATFFAQMRHYGATRSDDHQSRRMALMIAESIDKGKSTAKTEEVLAAISGFAATAARMSLSAPNVEGFAGMLAAMTRSKVPGLGPSESAAIIGTADAAMRRGGAFGESSMNFSYAALSRAMPGLDPIQAQMQMSGGLFGSARSVFGGNLLGKYAGQDASILPKGDLSSTTNLELMKKQLDLMGYSGGLRLDAIKNIFGLASHQQAAALDMFKSEDLTRTSGLLGRAGKRVEDVSATGIANLVEISGAGEQELRGGLLKSLLGREDISKDEKTSLENLAAGDDIEKLREEMARVVANHDQESTDGSKIRASIADLHTELARIGGVLLPAVTTIKDMVVGMARIVAPGSPELRRFRIQSELPEYEKEKAQLAQDHEEKLRILEESGAPRRRIDRIRHRQDKDMKVFLHKHKDHEEALKLREEEKAKNPLATPLNEIDPSAQLQQQKAQDQKFVHQIDVAIRDRDTGRVMADPVTSVRTGRPTPFGAGAFA